MKQHLFFFLTCLTLCFGMACGGGDSAPGFPVGTWELSHVTFSTDGASVSTDGSRLSIFKLNFMSDNSLVASGTGSDQNYTWSYDEATGIISITGGLNVNIEATMGEDEFSYKAYAIADMSNTTGDERQIAEFAVSSFIQGKAPYSTTAGLDVYFNFSKI